MLKLDFYAIIVYFDIFDYPLTLDELKEFCNQDNLEKSLQNDPRIEFKNGFYFLKGREEILETREQRAKISANLFKKVRKFELFFQMIPFIKMVAVCNTLAFNNATKDSDIDLFMVVKKGRLCLSRTLVTLLFHVLGVRRHGSKIAGRFCLSFYVTEDNLNLKNIQLNEKDIYLPFWIATLKPFYGFKIYREFLSENDWIKEYFDYLPKYEEKFSDKENSFIKKNLEFLLNGRFGDFLEKILITFQKKRLKNVLPNLGLESSVIVNEKMLKFHNVDKRKEIALKFWSKL